MNNWQRINLTDISRPKQWQNLSINELEATGYPVYGANGIIGYYHSYNHENATIAITCRGASCGNVHITSPKSYITSNAMALDGIDSTKFYLKFIYYALKSRGLNDVITGSAQPQITRESLKSVKLTIPTDIKDQIRIADLLSRAEGLIAQRKESIRLLDELVKGTFLEMFTVSNSNLWPVKKMNELALKGKGSMRTGPFGSSLLHSEFLEEGDVKVLGIDNVVNNSFEIGKPRFISFEKYEKLKQYTVFPGDVLITIMGTNGRCAVAPTDIGLCINTKHIAAITLNKKIANPNFISYSIVNDPFLLRQIANQTRGAIMSGLNLTIIKELKIKLPPIDVQGKFATLLAQVESIKNHYLNSLKELEHLFGSLSQRAFRGELDLEQTTDDDKNDAPSELPRELVKKRKEGMITRETVPVSNRTVSFWMNLLKKYPVYPTATDFDDMAVHHWQDYDAYFNLFNLVRQNIDARRESEITKTGRYETPEFSFSHMSFFSPFILQAPEDHFRGLVQFIKKNPPSDGDLYQLLPLIEKKAGGRVAFMDMILLHLTEHVEEDDPGKKRLKEKLVSQFTEEAEQWGIYSEEPYNHLKQTFFNRLQARSGDLDQAFDDQTGEVYLYIKK